MKINNELSHGCSCIIQNGLKRNYRTLNAHTQVSIKTHIVNGYFLSTSHSRSVNVHFVKRFPWIDTDREISTSTHKRGVNVRPKKIISRLTADQMVRNMDENERMRLARALEDLKEEMRLEKHPVEEPSPSFRKLRLSMY